MRNLFLEAFLVAVAGLLLGFAANTLSPRGLKLTRNYSPGHALSVVQSIGNSAATNRVAATQLLQKQLQAEGLQLADADQVGKLFRDPKKDQDLIVFVDARDDDHYQAGHVPGAYRLDHYHPENYLASVLPACQVAEKIVVYCKGGNCEDSEQTAILLRDAGLPRDRIFVYAGGFDEWTGNHLPVEIGSRNSGQLQQAGAPATGK